MVALLIEDVTLIKGEQIAVHVRFRGGKTCSQMLPRPLPIARVRKTRPEVVQALDELLDTCTDREAAVRLNVLGHRNWKGEPFTAKRVSLVRCTYKLQSRFERLRARGLLTGGEMAKQLGVSTTTVHEWGRAGLLERELYGNATRCLYRPLPQSQIVTKGRGGRHAQQPTVTIAPTSAQETV